MVIKINKQIHYKVENKILLVKNIKDRVKLGLKEAKDLVDCLDGDQSYVIPTSFTRENRIELYNVLAEAGLEPEWCKNENETDEEDEDPDSIGTHIKATEIGTIVIVRMRISQKVSSQLVGLLKDAGFSSAEKKPSIANPDSDIVTVGTNFGQDEVDIDVVLNYVRDVLRFKKSLEIETVLKHVIDQIGIKRALEEYKESL